MLVSRSHVRSITSGVSRRSRRRQLVVTGCAFVLLTGGVLAGMSGPAISGPATAALSPSVTGENDHLVVAGTSVEYLDEPLGLDARRPRFSWTLEADRRDATQAAYQVQVATGENTLEAGEALVWDTGRVPTNDSVNVQYGGEALTSATRYYWRVRAWSAEDTGPSAWSEISTFETGLFEAEDWVAQWVAPAISREGGSYLRSEINLPTDVEQVRLYVSGRGNYERGPDGQGICCEQQFGLARGVYEAHINGQRVSDSQVESTMVDTRVRALYRTYDVTDLLTAGDNVLGILIGEDSDVLAQLRVTTTDGEVLDFGTDGSWTSAPGPVIRAHRYHGETYDARKEITGWSTVDMAPSTTWQPVRVSSTVTGRLEAATFEPMRVVRTHEPVAVTSPAPGVHVLDFGTNLTGWTQMSLDLPAGATVTLKHGERLSNGRVDNSIIGAQQTSRYTAAGGQVTWEPSFVYAGFRWVEVTGLPGAPAPGTIVAREVHNDVEPTGTFSSSNDLLNRLHKANVQTESNGLHAVPEDTPTREKRGWMADAHIAAEAVINNFGVAAFYSNWVEEMRSAQQGDGRVPDIVPTEPAGAWETRSDPAWAVAHVLIPAYVNERYADTRVLAEHYDSLRDYLAYLETTTSGDLLTSPVNTWGNDWLALENTDSVLFRSGFYLWALREGADAARQLDKGDDAEQMDDRADRVASAINERYFDEEAESYGSSQFANAFPLVLDIVPDGHVEGVVDNLVRDVVDERGGHFTGGLPGIKYIPEALALHGHSDVVLDVVTNTAYPGWGYMLENGPGTIWEDWGGASSLNHPMFTSIDNWLYDSVAGIDQAPGSTGYQHSVVAPQVTDRLGQGNGSVTTPYGTLSSAWKHVGGRLVQTVTVPVNTTSEVTVPADSARSVLEGTGYAQDAVGVHSLRETSDGVVVTVGSGTYEFRSDAVLGMLGSADDALRALDTRLDGPGVTAAATRKLSRDVGLARRDVQGAIDARMGGASLDRVRELAAEALGRLHVLAVHVDDLEADGQLTGAAAAEVRRHLEQARGELSTLVTRSDGITVELEPVDDAVAGSALDARLVVTNGSTKPLTRAAALLLAPDGWAVRTDSTLPSAISPGQSATAVFRVTVPLAQPLGEVVLEGSFSAARNGTRLRVPVRLPVSVRSPVSIDTVRALPRVLETEDTDTVVSATMSNRSQQSVQVTLAVENAPEGWTAPGTTAVEIPAGATRSASLTLQRTAESASGGDIVVSASSGGQEWAQARTSAFVRGAGCDLDPRGEACLTTDFTLLHNFEEGAEGWIAGEYVTSASSVPSMANSPGAARLGRRLLEATAAANTPADAWRTVSVREPVPVPLGRANALVVHVNAYGGAPSGPYQARVVLRDSTGSTLEKTQAISPDAWTEVRVPFGDWAGVDLVSIEVSFRAAGDRVWPGNFQIDQVGLDAAEPPPSQSLNLAAGRPVVARATLNCCAWGNANLVDGVRASTPSSRGYTSDPPRGDPDNVEWVQVDLGQVRQLSSVWLWPRTATAGEPVGNGGAGYPDTFAVEVSDDGVTWSTLRSLTGETSDGSRGMGYDVEGEGRFVRVHVTKLGRSAPDESSQGFYRLQLAELEVYGP